MGKFAEKFESIMMPVVDKISTNASLQAITGGLMSLLPVTILGAIASLLGSFQVDFYQNFITSTGIKTLLSFIPLVTTNMFSVYAVFAIAKSMAEKLGHKQHSTTMGLMTLVVFFLMIPLGVSGVAAESKEVVVVGNALGMLYLGAPGLFSAILLGLLVPRIYGFVLDRGWVIKMPAQVPPMVSSSFSGLIPAFIIGFVFILVRYGFSLTAFGNMNTFIYQLIQTPLRGLTASPFTFIVFLMLTSLLWFFGIHGGMVIMPLLQAMYTTAGLENLAALEAGQAFPNIVTLADWAVFGMIGGGGATIGFAIWLAFFAKSQRYKTLGKVALPSSLVGINEPITFGTPVVLNPILIIPFLITPVITFSISYILKVVGFLTPLNGVGVPLGTPLVFSALIAGGPMHALVQVLLIALTFVIYYPFALMLDKKALAEEAAEL